MDKKEKLRRELLERYISTGKVGLVKPSSDEEAVDLIETVIELYNEQPIKLKFSDISEQFKNLLDF